MLELSCNHGKVGNLHADIPPRSRSTFGKIWGEHLFLYNVLSGLQISTDNLFGVNFHIQ